MSIMLENELLRLEIQEPGALYRGARFDWTGQITQITFKGKHTFCTEEKTEPAEINLKGRGLYNEFGIESALGYDECPIGERFPKIGVGWLKKESPQPYHFYYDYNVLPFEFSFEPFENSINFACYAKPLLGYGFILKKRLYIEENTFVIEYVLENIGEKLIYTNEYVHNFLAINRQLLDEHYQLKFPFRLNPIRLREVVNPGLVTQFGWHEIEWQSTPKSDIFFSSLFSGKLNEPVWELRHDEARVRIREEVDFPIQKLNLWGNGHVVSPEVFFEISVLPGESIKWQRRYAVDEF